MPKITVDPEKLPEHILDSIVASEIPADCLLTMSPAEVFNAWCNYEGLINYGPTLRELMTALLVAQRS